MGHDRIVLRPVGEPPVRLAGFLARFTRAVSEPVVHRASPGSPVTVTPGSCRSVFGSHLRRGGDQVAQRRATGFQAAVRVDPQPFGGNSFQCSPQQVSDLGASGETRRVDVVDPGTHTVRSRPHSRHRRPPYGSGRLDRRDVHVQVRDRTDHLAARFTICAPRAGPASLRGRLRPPAAPDAVRPWWLCLARPTCPARRLPAAAQPSRAMPTDWIPP